MLSTQRINKIYLPGFVLPAEVEVTGSLEQALAGADIVLGVMPSAHARGMYHAMRPFTEPGAIFVSCLCARARSSDGWIRALRNRRIPSESSAA